MNRSKALLARKVLYSWKRCSDEMSAFETLYSGIVLLVMLFVAVVIVIAMAPVIGQLGGGLYEALFVGLAILVLIGGVAGYARRV